ncbi:hypothetical protein FACS189413_09940 [Bacteroidia bacterium]|nr:hypothetical protein FACS189413_09940 [Bacteroidia bacterium]
MKKEIAIFVLLMLVCVFRISAQGSSQGGWDNGTGGSGSSGGTNNVIDQLTYFNVIPSLPQVSGLGNYGNPLLSGATGAPQISIPIYTLQEDGVSIPIALTYDATGIRAEEISTATGLKWHLQAGGSISRTIRGLADDDANGWRNLHDLAWKNTHPYTFPEVSWNSNINCYQQQLEDIENNLWDVLPDIYSYHLPEHQGSFFFDSSNQLQKVVNDDLKIDYSTSGWSCVNKMGVVYNFGASNSTITVQSSVNGGTATFNPARSGSGINEWHLNSITTKNSYINFSYTNYSFSYSITNGMVKRIDYLSHTTTTGHSANYTFNTKLLDKIESPHVRIEFVYATDNAASVWKKKLTEIKIISKSTEESKSFVLEYDRYGGCPKLRLRKITEQGFNSSASNRKWEFNYNTGSIPDMNTNGVDYFGYYNAAGNGSLIPVGFQWHLQQYSVLNSRSVNNSVIANGILNEIVYPTGGKTKFYYEANKETISGKDYYAPGVRLQKTEDLSDTNSKYNVKEYFYSGLTGNTWEQGLYDNFHEPSGDDTNPSFVMLYSSPKRLYNPKHGYGYKQIETRYYSNNTAVNKEITYYEINSVGSTYYPKIVKKLTYKGMNTLLQKMEYEYSTQGSNTTYPLGWRIESDDYINNFSYYCNNIQHSTKHYYKGIFTDFKYESHRAILVKHVTTTDYSSNDSIKKIVSYGYNSNLQLDSEYHSSSKKNSNSDSDVYEKQILYPDNNLYPNLYAKYMIGLPIGMNEYKQTSYTISHPNLISHPDQIYIQLVTDTLLVGKAKWEYDNNGNPTALYEFINNPTNDYLALKENYTYGANGKIRTITYKDETSTVYLWGYNNQYPIAEIQNATYAQIQNILGSTLINRVASANTPAAADLTAINNLRNNTALPYALVTTYTYRPLVGMTGKTDPRGIATTYEYDSFGRLESIKDENGDLLENTEYHYKN